MRCDAGGKCLDSSELAPARLIDGSTRRDDRHDPRSWQGTAGPGVYRLGRVNGGRTDLPDIVITLPEGWHNIDGWALHRGSFDEPTVAIQFWDVGQVYGHPCQWQGTLSDPGPSVDELADALVDIPLRNASQPVDVVLDGRSGRYLEWSVPADIDFMGCDTDGTEHNFESRTAAMTGTAITRAPGRSTGSGSWTWTAPDW